MMRAGMKRVAVVILVALGLCVPVALAAKGDPQKKITKAGQAQAVRAGLRKADFPAGWTQKPNQKNNNEDNPRCSYYNPDQSDLVEIGDFDSPDFEQADGSSVSSSTGVFRTVAMAKTGYSRVAMPALPRCLAELFKKGTGANNPTTVVSAKPLSFPRYGDQSNAYRVLASVKTPSVRVRVYLDIFLLRQGATAVAVLALGINHALPTQLEQSLVGKLASRAK
jgi:hypothetical protein